MAHAADPGVGLIGGGGPPAPLRPVEAFPVEVDEGTMVALRDPEGIADDAVVLSPAAFLAASLFDGARTLRQIQAALAGRLGGGAPPLNDLDAIVAELDARGFLDTPSFRLRRADARRRWNELRVRPSSHAGQAYPDDPAELAAFIREAAGNAPAPSRLIVPGAPPPAAPRGLIVPHIDFPRGGAVYARAHATLAAAPPELVVILGVAHLAPPVPFILTRKGFETPLGVMACDHEAADAFAAACGGWETEEELAHRMEHSIEFQVVWLQALHPAAPMRILPVLCSSFEMLAGGKSPASEPRIAAGIAGLKAAVRGRRALVLASVDFAHVGPRFGDEIPVDDALARSMEEADRALLAPALAGDAEGFWTAALADENARRVDALSAVYTLLSVLDGPSGEILAHGTAPDPAGGLVSFAAASFR